MKLRLLGQAQKLFFLCALFLSMTTLKSHAANIDAFANVIFETTPITFADGEHAYGFVYFDQGLTANGLFNINALFPVAGTINLATDSGIMALDGDLTLASNATFANGGEINGQNYTIFLHGDLTIPANKTLKISGNLTIDGLGHNLIFSDESVLLIDGAAATKLTIRNTKIKGLRNNTVAGPAIQFGSALNQKLILDGSDLLLSSYFTYEGGALDIVNTVNLKGDSKVFQYASNYNLTIKKNSRFFGEVSSVFYYNPSDSSQKHVVMEDLTSQLYLNGCLFAAAPGLMLTKGHLLIDHDVIFAPLDVTTKNKGIIFGDGNAAHDLEIDIFPGAGIDINQGYLTYKNVDPN